MAKTYLTKFLGHKYLAKIFLQSRTKFSDWARKNWSSLTNIFTRPTKTVWKNENWQQRNYGGQSWCGENCPPEDCPLEVELLPTSKCGQSWGWQPWPSLIQLHMAPITSWKYWTRFFNFFTKRLNFGSSLNEYPAKRSHKNLSPIVFQLFLFDRSKL